MLVVGPPGSAGDVNVGVSSFVGGLFGLACAIAYVSTKHYIANNLLGIAFCMQVPATSPVCCQRVWRTRPLQWPVAVDVSHLLSRSNVGLCTGSGANTTGQLRRRRVAAGASTAVQ